MYLQDFTGDKDAVFDAAFTSPKLHPKKTPTLDVAMRVVGDAVTKAAKEAITRELHVDIMDAVAMYEVNNGEYEDTLDGTRERDDYESGMDDAVEASLEPWVEYLSADWLGRSTVDTQVWLSTDEDRNIIDRLAASAAAEVFKQLTADKTPVQVLSNAGIVKKDVEDRLASHLENTGETNMTDTTLAAVVAKIKTHVGKDFDQMAVYEDIEILVEEDDDILAASAASRLGITGDDVETVQLAVLDMDDAPTQIVEMIDEYVIPSARKKTAAKRQAKADEKTAAAASGLDPSVFVALKECGAGDTAMAEALGVSRSTYTNYIKGKTHLEPDGDQYSVLRGEVVERANKLLAALSELDGAEAQQVA